MVPKLIPESERKQPVSISLTAVEIVMLNKLAEDTGKNRSRLVAGMIRASAQIKMGLSELETHSGPVQKWRQTKRRTIYAPAFAKTWKCCPPGLQPRCTHSKCVQIYDEAGV